MATMINVEGKMESDAKESLQDEPLEDDDMDEVKTMRFAVHSQVKSLKWTDDDQQAINSIRNLARGKVDEIFASMFVVLDNLYSKARVPLVDDEGQPIKDRYGRNRWKQNSAGETIEDWNLVSNSEIDNALLKLQELKFIVTPQVKELFLEAYFAKNSFKDDWYEEYRLPGSGTATIREATANAQTIDARYNSIFRFWIYSYAESVEKELNNIVSLLGRLRAWRTRDL